MTKNFLKLFIIMLSYLFCINDFSYAQGTDQIFAYASNQQSSISLSSKSSKPAISQYKKAVVQKVLDDLIIARGDARLQKPKLIMNDAERYVAWMNPVKVQIGIEEKAYDICLTFGKDSLNAIAALLGHEITHYYDKHNWAAHFAKENQNLSVAQQLSLMNESLKNETQADYLGGFLGFSAGYNTLGLMPKVLEKVYTSYNLNPILPGYPSLSDRKKIAQQAMIKLEDLANVFEMANYLITVEEYGMASEYFKFILKEFQSREIYNNLGVAKVLESLEYFDEDEIKFILPIELDSKSRLQIGKKGIMGFSERENERKRLLAEAIENFETALQLDKEYAIGYLNLSCTYVLIGDLDEVEYQSRRALRLAKSSNLTKTLNDIHIIDGITAYLNNDISHASLHFEKAASAGSELAKTNLRILNDTPHLNKEAPGIIDLKPERIDNILLDEFLEELQVDKTIVINKNLLFAIKEFANSKVVVNLVNQGEKFTLLHIANNTYTGSSNKGISIGEDYQNLEEAYGSPDRTVELSNGTNQVYLKKNLFFNMDKEGKVNSWGTYRKS